MVRKSKSQNYASDEESSPSALELSQHPQTFELSQALPEPRANEKNKLAGLNGIVSDKAITSLSRLLLFKAFSGQAIDRRKCIEEAVPKEIRSEKISNALMQEAQARLLNVWGMEIKGVPNFMLNSLPTKYKDRYYVINHVDDPDGSHSVSIHNQEHTRVEKGLLMVVLALAFCKGFPIQTNAGHRGPGEEDGESIYTARWIKDIDLYRLLHNLDDNIPEEPPKNYARGAGSKRKSFSSSISSPSATERAQSSDVVNVEEKLEKFVSMDYLLKEKSGDLLGSNSQSEARTAILAEDGFCYAMGPRAALEIGRRQLIYFCADVLDEQPDPTMLEEINDTTLENNVENEDDE